MKPAAIKVRSHVGRDLLQSASLFKTDKQVVWEYVANALQYIDPGVNPQVNVVLNSRAKTITISDNGRGMNHHDLQHFFLMHGENLDRKAGRRGRGLFGTGKAAAFGIAECLHVSSIRNYRRNAVELRKRDVEAAGDADIPVRMLEHDITTKEANGTVIHISGVRIRRWTSQVLSGTLSGISHSGPASPLFL